MPRRRKRHLEDGRDMRALERRLKTMRAWLAAQKEALQFRDYIREKRKNSADAESRRQYWKRANARAREEREAWRENWRKRWAKEQPRN